MLITDYIKKECVIIDLHVDNKEDLIHQLFSVQLSQYPEVEQREAIKGLLERENVMSTGIGNGVAIPHARLSGQDKITVSAGLIKEGIDYGAVDKQPVKLIFLVLFPKDAVGLQLKFLARISRLLNQETLRTRLENCQTPEAFISALSQFEESHLH